MAVVFIPTLSVLDLYSPLLLPALSSGLTTCCKRCSRPRRTVFGSTGLVRSAGFSVLCGVWCGSLSNPPQHPFSRVAVHRQSLFNSIFPLALGLSADWAELIAKTFRYNMTPAWPAHPCLIAINRKYDNFYPSVIKQAFANRTAWRQAGAIPCRSGWLYRAGYVVTISPV